MKKMQLIITLHKSLISCSQSQIQTAYNLGLKKINQQVIKEDTIIIRGMIRKIYHLVSVKRLKKVGDHFVA